MFNIILTAVGLSAAGATAPTAGAQAYPVRPIRAIVGFVPGGATDIMARQLGQKLTEGLGQQMIVDNRAGGGGIIAATLAKDAAPDGHTLTASNPYFLVVHPGVAAGSVKEFIALARARPGQLNYASSGTGGGAHLAMELFRTMARIDLVHVPYKGAAQATGEVVAGHIHMTFSQPAVMLPHGRAGRLKVLGVTSLKPLHE